MAEPVLPRVKVCGVRTLADIEPAFASGLDAVGIVAWPASPRFVDAGRAVAVVRALPPEILPIAVMVDASPKSAAAWLLTSGARAVQLCGAERASEWRSFPFTVFRRVAVDGSARAEIAAWRGIAAAFVLDHPSSHGGTGIGVDLELAAELAAIAPCLLAGGLAADNVEDRIARVRPWGVDASSRLESAPGMKDPGRVVAFVRQARCAFARAVDALEPGRTRT